MPLISCISRFLAFLLLCASSGMGLAAEASTALPVVPAPFEQWVPTTLGNGLALVEVRKRCEDCEPWRVVELRSSDPAAPPSREKVSVRAGVTAMYAYPGTGYFANVKVEQSMPGMFGKDKAVLVQALDHEFKHLNARVASYLEANPAVRDQVRAELAAGKDYAEFERRTVQGIEYVTSTVNVMKLAGSGALSQIHFFDPERELIVTAYLLKNKRAKFTNIEEFLRLRADFIRAWTEFLARGAGVQEAR